jgi:hypothetical protein
MSKRSWCVLLLVLSAFIAGCGEVAGGPAVAPVTGRVLCNSKPVVAAHVTFSPTPKSAEDREPGKPGTGFTDTEGRFVLSTYKELDGAQIGSHDVSVLLDDMNPAPCKRLSQMQLEVTAGPNDFNLELNQ